MKVVIVGAGGHGQVVADILRQAARAGGPHVIAGYVDDNRPVDGALVGGARVLGGLSSLAAIPHDAVIVAVGDNQTRARLWRAAGADERFATAIHPSAILSDDVRIGDGSMVCAGAIVNTGTTVGQGVILNTGCTVDHHTSIGDFVHIAPGVHMGGDVRVGCGAFVGIGAIVLPGVDIGDGAVVGAGAVVTRNVPPGVTVVGCPARPLDQRPVAVRR